MAITDIGIDMGSVNLRVYEKDKGVAIQEPSMAAYDKENDRILSYGEDARQLVQRSQGQIVAIRPLKGGVIFDYTVLEGLLKHFITKAMGRRFFRKPYISICLPSGVTAIERRAVEEAAYQAGARGVTFVDTAVAAAIGAGIDITKPFGNLVVDIGGGTTDIAVISIGATVLGETLKIAGTTFHEAIARYIRRYHSLFIDAGLAEEIKCRIGTCYRRQTTDSMEVTGRNVISGIRETIRFTSEEVRLCLEDSVLQIVEAVHGVLEKTPPELAADIAERGIVLTGGGALLKGLEEVIGERTGINVMTADVPELSVAVGTGKYTQLMELLGDE